MTLHSNIIGEGKPFVILHGFLGMGDNWKSLALKFSQDYEVHLVDQRNHGRSFHDDPESGRVARCSRGSASPLSRDPQHNLDKDRGH